MLQWAQIRLGPFSPYRCRLFTGRLSPSTVLLLWRQSSTAVQQYEMTAYLFNGRLGARCCTIKWFLMESAKTGKVATLLI